MPAQLARRSFVFYSPWRIDVEPNNIESSKSSFEPKPLSLRQNIVLTIKVLVGAGAMIALLWLASVYTAR